MRKSLFNNAGGEVSLSGWIVGGVEGEEKEREEKNRPHFTEPEPVKQTDGEREN